MSLHRIRFALRWAFRCARDGSRRGGSRAEIRNRIQLDENNRVSETLLCYLQMAWEESGGDIGNKIGSIYCDEFHWSMWAAYDNDIVTELPRLLTKNDPFCRFEVHRHQKPKPELP